MRSRIELLKEVSRQPRGKVVSFAEDVDCDPLCSTEIDVDADTCTILGQLLKVPKAILEDHFENHFEDEEDSEEDSEDDEEDCSCEDTDEDEEA